MTGAARDYVLLAPETLHGVLNLLAGDWRPLAGGTDLMVLLNAGSLPFRNLVSLHKVGALQQIEVSEQEVAIGAGVTYTAIRQHALLQNEFDLLCRAAAWTGGIANQNRGTLGGNIVNASPAADSPPMLLVYDAELELTSLRGVRRVPYESFHTGYKTMRMLPDELLTRVILPRPTSPAVTYARKVGSRKAMAISKVSMGAAGRMRDRRLDDVRIAVGSVAPFPLRCRRTEAELTNHVLSPAVRARAAEALAAEISPIDDIRSTRAYRRQVTLNLLGEFLDLLHATYELEIWNGASAEEAARTAQSCCGSERWAAAITAARPLATLEAISEASDSIWRSLEPEDWREAFRAHPRIGATPSRVWELQEQAGMQSAAEALRIEIAVANATYEAKFGFLYIVCATGKTAAELLAILRQRLNHSSEEEMREAAEQQRQITQLRLRKWLAG